MTFPLHLIITINPIVAILTVLRERGTFGAVIVPFAVQPTGQTDLASSMPIVSFAAGQTTAVSD